MFQRPIYVLRLFLFATLAVIVIAVSGCSQTSTPQNVQPIEVVSVVGPLQPINPGGPNIEITLKNASVEPVVSLNVALDLNTGRPFNLNFDVTPSNPLMPDKSISVKQTLIGGGFSDNLSYPLTVSGTFRNGDAFTYTQKVRIVHP